MQENRYDAENLRFELLENGRKTSFVYHNGELLHEAEKAAGGSLDDFIELKKNWFQNEEGTIKLNCN